MSRLLSAFRFTAACLAFAGPAALATPSGDDPLANLQAAFVRAVLPGDAADLHRDLLATVLSRVFYGGGSGSLLASGSRFLV